MNCYRNIAAALRGRPGRKGAHLLGVRACCGGSECSGNCAHHGGRLLVKLEKRGLRGPSGGCGCNVRHLRKTAGSVGVVHGKHTKACDHSSCECRACWYGGAQNGRGCRRWHVRYGLLARWTGRPSKCEILAIS